MHATIHACQAYSSMARGSQWYLGRTLIDDESSLDIEGSIAIEGLIIDCDEASSGFGRELSTTIPRR